MNVCWRGAWRWSLSGRVVWVGVGLVGFAAVALGADGGSGRDKSSYHLFKPTPPELMRPLSTDRPDQTESPFTVDAGHWQMEWDLANGTWDRATANGVDERTRVWGVGGLNLKLGLWNSGDLQVVLDGHQEVWVKDAGAGNSRRAAGFGEVQTRLKINLWGNDGGSTAFALMPFVKWPLAASGVRNGKTEGGLILPLAVAGPAGWNMGLMAEVDFVRDANQRVDTEYFQTITLGHDIVGNWGGYVELAARFTPESDAQWQGQVGVGLTYGFGANSQLDLGCNFGVTSVAPDCNPFIGLTWRY